jgi:hypothetical protein
MSEEPDNLVLRLLEEIRTEIASLRDDLGVLTAIVQRLDNSRTRLLTEIRATHSEVSRHGDNLVLHLLEEIRTDLEGQAPSDDE